MSDSDELRPQVSLSRAAFDLQWDALVECSADELDVSALPHRRALRVIGSTADVAYERLCTLLRLFNGHFEVTGPDGGKVLDCDHCGTPCIPTCVACGETYSTTAEAAACEDAGFRSPRAPGAWRPITQPPSAEVHAWCGGRYLFEKDDGSGFVTTVNFDAGELEEFFGALTCARYLPIPPTDERRG